MNMIPETPLHSARRYLVVCFAVLFALTVSTVNAADESLQDLQSENKALREQNPELQRRFTALEARMANADQPTAAPASTSSSQNPAQPSTASTTGYSSSSSLKADEGVQVMSAFEVARDKDYGYLKTNAATATRIGMEIQKVPMNVSVVSREFLDDTNARSLMDILGYTASASDDTHYAMHRPDNESTPQGKFTMRGFAVNTLMRNGIFRYTSYNLDRVEVVKGAAAVFFGQGYPGGVINYITKQPVFAKTPSTFKYSVNNNSGQKVVADINLLLSKKAAFRMVGAWEDTQGERRFEFRKNINLTPSLTVISFDSGKLKINAEWEYLRDSFNQNDYDWLYSDFDGWRAAAAGSVPVRDSVNTPSLSYINYIRAKRNSTNDQSLPAYTSVQRGASYTDASGEFIHDEAFNYTSRGARSMNGGDSLSPFWGCFFNHPRKPKVGLPKDRQLQKTPTITIRHETRT